MATSKYSDIEIQTAKNLLKKGLKWIVRNQSGRLSAHACKPSKVDTHWWSVGYSDCTCDYVPIFQSVRFDDKEPTSLESIVHPQILDDAEKRYLAGVIRPFRNKIKQIAKYGGHYHNYYYEYIAVMYYVDQALTTYSFGLPVFPEGTMYKGMEVNRYYTLEELGL